MFFFNIGGNFNISFLFRLVLLQQFALHVLEELVDLNQKSGTLALGTSLVL